jgi:hypothetical protein
MIQSRGLLIKCQCMGTTCPCIERSDQSILKLSCAIFEGRNSIKDLLFVLNFKRVCDEKILEMRGDLGTVLLQEAAQDPNNFEHRDQTNEPGFCSLSCRSTIWLACRVWFGSSCSK